MTSHRFLRAGALALACASAPAASFAQAGADDLLTGDARLACEAILCLSSSLRPSECAPSLARYFGIQIFNKHGLDWSATVAARRAFLNICPAGAEPGMPERLDAISKGAGKCDPDYLNAAYARTAYRWRLKGYFMISGSGETEPVYEVHPIQTVSPSTLPAYCITYTEHEWTYELGMKYVGDPLHGGWWVTSDQYSAEYGKWLASHGSTFTTGWNFTWEDPRDVANQGNNS